MININAILSGGGDLSATGADEAATSSVSKGYCKQAKRVLT